MIKKTILFISIFAILFQVNLRADEGMWIPLLLKNYNIEQMKKKGFKLTAEDIYSINQASMKDAVMIFGGGCTAELISNQGLILTNHHCGYDVIQSHSTLEHNYLTDGYWAADKGQELVSNGLTVTFLVRMEDVTEKVLQGVTDEMPVKERNTLIAEHSEQLKLQATDGTHYFAEVKPFFAGNNYYLFVQEEFKDIRFVGAPPSAIGKFGGETDNWMWPRHTADFSLFRIYADKDNKPAEYSPDNVPYKPKKYFPISIKGVKKGDFTMVFGYPGRTSEYLSSYAVDMIMNIQNPTRIAIRQNIIDIMQTDMQTDPKIRLQYSSKLVEAANAWKKWIGQNKGLRKINAIEVKRKYEERFTAWVNSSEQNKKYANLLPEYERLYKKLGPFAKAEDCFTEAIWQLDFISMTTTMEELMQKNEPDNIEEAKKIVENFFKDYNLETDKKLFRKMLQMYYDNAGEQFIPDILDFVENMNVLGISKDQAFDIYTDYMYKNSMFINHVKVNQFLTDFKKEDVVKIENDPLYKLYRNMIMVYVLQIRPVTSAVNEEITQLNRTYMKALQEFEKDKIFYPDANFTLRVAYGQVDDYFPADGVYYNYFTTLDGIMQKDNPEIYDYKVPEKLKELYKNKDYGRYAENGIMHVCFTASNHTTGGNSGSPVLNANGELIGTNFDRNWEGTMSDIMYDPNQCRNISLDIRFTLFIIEKFAGAKNLIDEMTIISE